MLGSRHLPSIEDMMPLELAQALDLAQLVELEARWENLRIFPARNPKSDAPLDLADVQRAYESFQRFLLAYNRRYKPQYTPEVLLNTVDRLGRWCASRGTLFGKIEGDPGANCPAELVEKAYRRAERIAGRLCLTPPARRTPPQTIQAAIEDLQIVASWCGLLHASASA
jgi:hypothetical protein